LKFATDYQDDESSDESGELSEREGKKIDESSIRITFENVGPITLTRNFFSRYCHYPQFESAITGCFTKVRLGDDYRFVRIEGLVDVAKYSVEGVFVDQGLELGQGSSRRVINMDFASNSAVARVKP
jgi:RNA polymerase-associated protein RTF1